MFFLKENAHFRMWLAALATFLVFTVIGIASGA